MPWQAIVLQGSRALWLSTPFLLVLGLLLLSMVPMRLTGYAIPAPDFALIAIFFWTIYGPQFLPPAAVFALGLTLDLLGTGPIGFWTTLFLAVYGFTLSQRVFFIGRTVMGVWAGFAVIATLAGAIAWAIAALYYATWVDPWPIVTKTFVTILAFPIVGRILLTQRRALTTAPERP